MSNNIMISKYIQIINIYIINNNRKSKKNKYEWNMPFV